MEKAKRVLVHPPIPGGLESSNDDGDAVIGQDRPKDADSGALEEKAPTGNGSADLPPETEHHSGSKDSQAGLIVTKV